MARCIYTKLTEHDTEFKKREHIFPAGIGGSKMLPQGDVSDYANEVFSKLELNFMRESIISLPRVFYGPGKRGSLSPKKRTKSKVSLMKSEENFFLGYMELAAPKTITQLHINYGDVKKKKKQNLKISFPPDKDFNECYTTFIKKISGNRYVKIKDSDLDINNFIVGYHEKNLFIAYNDASEIDKFHDYLKNHFKVPEELIKDKLEKGDLKANKNQPIVTLDLSFDMIEYSRVCAKVAFNALCHLKGSEFVLREEFDKIRDFIMNGEGNLGEFVQLPGKEVIIDVKKVLGIKKLQHSVIFSKNKKNLCAILTLYGIDHLILLSDNYLGEAILEGFICNWEEKTEVTLMDRIVENSVG